MEADLPIVPCYESANCEDVYNCGGESGVTACPNDNTVISGLKNCPSGSKEGYCWGNDSNFCSGIYTVCDDPDYKCGTKQDGVFYNFLGQSMGCSVPTDQTSTECMEFVNSRDEFSGCQDSCWKIGGRQEVDEYCERFFKDEASCESMDYFCKWNGAQCNAHSVFDKPTPPSASSRVINILPPGECQGGPSELCKEFDGVPPSGPTAWFVTCAQSSWSSTQKTSVAPDAQICCLHKPGSGIEKKCISMPRCQFVKETCDCGLKDIGRLDPMFLCARNYNNTFGDGYCTWCKGQQLKDFDFKASLPSTETAREHIEWFNENGSCSNRCDNYNECEINESELLWNQCVWETSNRRFTEAQEQGENFPIMGVNPDIVVHDPNLLKTDGFCPVGDVQAVVCDPEDLSCQSTENVCQPGDTVCLEFAEAQRQVAQECESQLLEQITTRNKDRLRNPGLGLIPKGTLQGRWEHSCVVDPNTGAKVATNFACTWCPSLQETVEEPVDDSLTPAEIAGISVASGSVALTAILLAVFL